MRNRGSISALRLFSIAMIILAVALGAVQLVTFSRVRAYFPSGLVIAGVPVGGLDRAAAAQRLLEVYSRPVELVYNGARIELDPSVVEFKLDLDSMLAAADLQRTEILFWEDFWGYLWGRIGSTQEIPLRATYSEPRLRLFLEDISVRYDQPSTPAMLITGTTSYQAGQPGTLLDADGAVAVIDGALRSITNRQAELPLERTEPSRPAFRNLEYVLQSTIQTSNFDGLVGVYLQDLQSSQEIHFAYRQGQTFSVNPDVAFTASSIIKVPIMISAYSRMESAGDEEAEKLIAAMIEESGNEAADWLMDRVIDENRGPLLVTEDIRALGLNNTFLAGYFTLGSPLLATIQTPANSRTDINTDPDVYSQTTPSDIGMLLSDLYQCSQNGGGTLQAVFPEKITQAECQKMITHLINNRLPSLLTAGIKEGTQIAHKHGWVTDPNGIIHTIGDAGIIYTPSGNFVMVVFLYHPDQLFWDPANELIAQLASAAYNFYNLPE